MNGLAALAFALAGIHVGSAHVLPVGYAPAWSPDGRRIAYVTRGDLWTADTNGTHARLLLKDADQPAWSPNGRRLAFTRAGFVYTVRADGDDVRKLAPGEHPAWSPNGARIALDRDDEIVTLNWFGGDVKPAGTGTDPAYAPNGELAVVQDGEIVTDGNSIGTGEQPAWSADGKHLAYVNDGEIYIDGKAVHAGTQPAWRPQPKVVELLPDFQQRPPSGLTIGGEPGSWLLGFTSLVDNIGLGPSTFVGVRPPGAKRMIGTQRVLLSNGKWRTYTNVAQFRYTNSPPHHHWHLMRFDSFELRTLAGTTLVRDRKSGFCLADHWGLAPGHWPNRKPHFLGNCAQFQPEATHVVMGTTPGFTDRYPAFFHGQNVDITGVPAGVYDLVHRVNESMRLHELRYDNDAASVRIRLQWRGGVPSVTVLRSCLAATC
ncbi:MAG TPA: lysyl oxidase family protein [Gaiellaceae bacterium]|nr:lysyl oxidase family protein [Gaiellaceae bacterium]